MQGETVGVRADRRAAGRLGLVLGVVLLLAACGLPRDPETTLQRVSGGTLRVGVSEHEPWVVLGGPEPAGVEVELVERFADEIDAEIEWVEGEVEELAGALHVREIDLLIAGLTSRSKIASEGALTHPYLTTAVVVAAPPEMSLKQIAGVEVAVEAATEEAGLLEKTDAVPVRVADVTRAEGAVVVEDYLVDDLDLEDTGVRLDEIDHVMAVPHGENAWLVRLERFLLEDPGTVARVLEENDGG
ncbi:MAG TPA: transporter substrate-binding domain-containing protein [Actinomycetota bacterium]|nr:transporter substrate-binding domain-containing protein [Actinomycetota bacterium]